MKSIQLPAQLAAGPALLLVVLASLAVGASTAHPSPLNFDQDEPTSRPALIGDYDPITVNPEIEVERIPLTANRGDREIPILVFAPKSVEGEPAGPPLPIVLFSHGLGGNTTGSTYYGEHLAARGYAVAFMQHPGSDESVWKDEPMWKRLRALKDAATHKNLVLRTEDVSTTIDALIVWNETEGHALEARLNTDQIGMSGHSFGAVTTQMVSGQRSGLFGPKLSEPRLDAAIALSPSPPQIGKPSKAFAAVFLPMMLMTGTKDDSPVSDMKAPERQLVYGALPETNAKYELVLDGAEHSIFTDANAFGKRDKPNPNHHRVILGLATAFWDAHLQDDEAAAAWLLGDGPRDLMEEADAYRFAPAQ